MITGETLITENGDSIKCCSDLLQRAYLDMRAKEDVMAILREENVPIRDKFVRMNFRLANSMEHQGLIEALLEQLTLVE